MVPDESTAYVVRITEVGVPIGEEVAVVGDGYLVVKTQAEIETRIPVSLIKRGGSNGDKVSYRGGTWIDRVGGCGLTPHACLYHGDQATLSSMKASLLTGQLRQ